VETLQNKEELNVVSGVMNIKLGARTHELAALERRFPLTADTLGVNNFRPPSEGSTRQKWWTLTKYQGKFQGDKKRSPADRKAKKGTSSQKKKTEGTKYPCHPDQKQDCR